MDEGAEIGIPQQDTATKAFLPKNPNKVGHVNYDLKAIAENNLRPSDSELAKAEILQEIETSGGKIPFSRFMEMSLYGKYGYYSEGKVSIGNQKTRETSDFVTSPEYATIFGQGIAQSVLKVWEAMGKPNRFDVVEMGAGQGALAISFLEWAKSAYPDFYQALHYNIVEYGGKLIPRQQDRVKQITDTNPGKVKWIHGSAYELPLANVEGAFISNELPDAFPVEIVKKANGQIMQKYVIQGLRSKDDPNSTELRETWDLPSTEVLDHIEEFELDILEDQEEPININAVRFQQQVDRALKRGAVLTIDYGKNDEIRGTAAARYYRRGKQGNEANKLQALTAPGEIDITASINFKLLEKVALEEGLTIAFSDKQSVFIRQVVSDVLRRKKDMLQQEKSWGQVKQMADVINDDFYLLRTGELIKDNDFYVQLLQKEVDLQTEQASDDILDSFEDFFPTINVPLNDKSNFFRLASELEARDFLSFGTKIEPGALEVPINMYDLIRGKKVLCGDGNKIWVLNLTKENLGVIATQAGYIYP